MGQTSVSTSRIAASVTTPSGRATRDRAYNVARVTLPHTEAIAGTTSPALAPVADAAGHRRPLRVASAPPPWAHPQPIQLLGQRTRCPKPALSPLDMGEPDPASSAPDLAAQAQEQLGTSPPALPYEEEGDGGGEGDPASATTERLPRLRPALPQPWPGSSPEPHAAQARPRPAGPLQPALLLCQGARMRGPAAAILASHTALPAACSSGGAAGEGRRGEGAAAILVYSFWSRKSYYSTAYSFRFENAIRGGHRKCDKR
ncbi:uncharacterized protein [Miscanthus floridulus]|uniref:uncharacterized protein n=1 Tax=Miscanthus floridulus TaxID=154761 RepID=UPI00345A2CF4